MKPVIHQPELYTVGADEAAEAIRRLQRIAETLKQSDAREPRPSEISFRNWWTRGLDALLEATRRYAPPLHWLWVVIVALVFFIYARLVASTVRLTVAGERRVAGCPFALRLGDVARMRELVARGRGAPQATIAISDHDSA
ncbi:MAG TPA: hypothetical protein VHR27_07940 [Blastocatellia bacterium]|jgi:hypothetical protein|nr:hypothetical protein [Blastocatellia bacterium]